MDFFIEWIFLLIETFSGRSGVVRERVPGSVWGGGNARRSPHPHSLHGNDDDGLYEVRSINNVLHFYILLHQLIIFCHLAR